MDLFSTAALNRVVQGLDQPASFLLDLSFPTVQTSENERIYFDVATQKNRITPFVAPHVAGKVVDRLGFTTKDFAPAYVKDKRSFKPGDAVKRRIGESIGGSLSAAERDAANLRESMADQLQMLTTREEVMASEVLRTGKVVVSGEGFQTQTVDFGRDAALTITLAGNDLWSANHADSNPLEDLEAWATLVTTKAPGSKVISYVMAPDAWSACRTRLIARSEAQMLFDWLRTGGSEAQIGPLTKGNGAQKARQVARIGDFDIWTYDDLYINDAGASTHLMPSGSVVAITQELEGTRCYGMIHDLKSGLKAQRYFVKSWEEEDPSVRWLLLQSAPLVVPFRPNASLCATVL